MSTDQSQKNLSVCPTDSYSRQDHLSPAQDQLSWPSFLQPLCRAHFLADLPWRQDDIARSPIHEELTSSTWGSSCSAFPRSLAINRCHRRSLHCCHPLSLSFGRDVRGPRAGSRQRHHSTAMGRKLTEIYTFPSTQVDETTAERTTLHLCVPHSSLWHKRDFHVSALCATVASPILCSSKPTSISPYHRPCITQGHRGHQSSPNLGPSEPTSISPYLRPCIDKSHRRH